MKSSQFGTFIVIITSAITLFIVYLVLKTGLSDTIPLMVVGSIILIFVVCILFFYRLTIFIDDEYVSFKFGNGWFGRKYKISEIKRCRPVKNPFWYGIGIRIIPNGWLYNVSGLQAIELTFRNKQEIVRIGTDKPVEIAAYINKKIGNPIAQDIIPVKKSKYRLAIFWSVTALIILLPVVFIIYGKQEPRVSIQNKSIVIRGNYGLEIPMDHITQMDTVSKMPAILQKTNGFSFGKTCNGNFKLKNIGSARLFIERGYSPYILIKTIDNESIFVNYKDRQKTIELFQKISKSKWNME